MDRRTKKRRQLPFPETIFTKVLAGYAALTLLIVALTGIFSYFLVRDYTMNLNKTELLSKAETLAGMIALPGGRTRVLNVARMKELQALADAQVIYVNTDLIASYTPYKKILSAFSEAGEPQEDTELQMTKVISALKDLELVNGIMKGASAADVGKLEFTGTEMVFAGAPIQDDGMVIGAIILCRPVVDISSSAGGIVSLESRAGVFALFIAAILAWFISGLLTRPLRKLNEAAGRVAEGHYGERVDIPQTDEIGQLGATLNLLSARLKDVFDTLSDEKSKLVQILAGIGEGIVAIDRLGKVVHYNPAALALLELSGWEAGASAEALGHREDLIRMLKSVMDQGNYVKTTWKNTSGIAIQAAASPFFSEEGKIIGAVGLLRDISESERLEQMRRDYIANISHELRTPLTGIRGMTEPLLDGLMETEQERMDSYTVIYQETLRLERLIGEMLDLSRLQEGRIELEMEPMEPEGLIEAAARRVRARAAEAGIKLTIEMPEVPVRVIGNENRIIQVLTIFLDNALGFTPSGGEIVLFLRKEGNKAVFGVRDTGPGIEPSDLPYIWERFYKADKSRMRTSGTGLGLAIAKLVVELMHGGIGVESEVGRGSTFTFTLSAV